MLEARSRLDHIERKGLLTDGLLSLVEFHGGHEWKSGDCKHNVNAYCQRFNCEKEPTGWELLAGVATFKKLDDNNWQVQASVSICDLCTLYEPRPSSPASAAAKAPDAG